MDKNIKIVISILLLCISLYFLDWATLATVFRTLNPLMLLVASFVCLLTYVIISIRWYLLARNVVRLSFWAQMKIYLYSNFLNTFTPANLGSDIYRLVSLKKYADSKLSILFCLIKERILGLLSYLLLYLLFLAMLWITEPEWIRSVRIYNIAGITIMFVVLVIFTIPLIKGFLEAGINNLLPNIFGKIFTYIREGLRFETQSDFLKLMGLSFLGLSITIAMFGIVAFGLGISISILKLGMIVILVELARMIPVSIQGIGLREGAYAYLFNVNGMSSEAGFLTGLISYLIMSLTLIACGGISFFIVKKQ